MINEFRLDPERRTKPTIRHSLLLPILVVLLPQLSIAEDLVRGTDLVIPCQHIEN